MSKEFKKIILKLKKLPMKQMTKWLCEMGICGGGKRCIKHKSRITKITAKELMEAKPEYRAAQSQLEKVKKNVWDRD